MCSFKVLKHKSVPFEKVPQWQLLYLFFKREQMKWLETSNTRHQRKVYQLIYWKIMRSNLIYNKINNMHLENRFSISIVDLNSEWPQTIFLTFA